MADPELTLDTDGDPFVSFTEWGEAADEAAWAYLELPKAEVAGDREGEVGGSKDVPDTGPPSEENVPET